MTDLQSSLNAEQEDRISEEVKSRASFFWIALTCLLAAISAGIYFYYTNVNNNGVIGESDETITSDELSPDIPETSTPDIPYTPSSFGQDLSPISDDLKNSLPDIITPLLTEEEAAIKMRDALSDLSDSPLLLESFYTSNPLQRIAAIVDSSSKGIVIHRLLALKPLKDKFSIIERQGILIMDPSGYRRYDPYVEALVSLDRSRLKQLFHKYRSYLEQAYATLGYQQEELDNAIIKSLDQIISAPNIKTAIAIERHEAVYRFMDEDLEALPEMHKQLLRMGPDNMDKIQSLAKGLRSSLLES